MNYAQAMPQIVRMKFPMKLNDRTVTSQKPALPASKSEFIFFDDDIPGFGLRLRRSGARSWVYQYFQGGRVKRVTLGAWPKLTASQARELVGPLAGMVALGRDPQAEKLKERSRKLTVGEIVQRYLAAKAKDLRPRSLVEVQRHLNVNAKVLHSVAIEALQRRDVAVLLNRLATESGPIQANRTRASLAAMLAWSIKQGLAHDNPASCTDKLKEKSRSRVLVESELREIWRALPAGDYGSIVKLLILTGQRREEIGGLCWSEIDLKQGTITLPLERTKNGRE